MKELYRKIQRMTKCTYTKLDKNGEENPHQVTNTRPKKTKELTANLKINKSTGKMNLAVWGLFFNSYAAIACLHIINNPKKGSRLIEGQYKGLFGGGTANKGSCGFSSIPKGGTLVTSISQTSTNHPISRPQHL